MCVGKQLLHSQAAGNTKAQPSSWRHKPARIAIHAIRARVSHMRPTRPVRAYANTRARVATRYLCLSHAETICGIIRLNRISLARLAQSAERKALNLVVMGSSPTVGVL